MALPVQSIRAAPEHRDVLQAVADLLRQGREQEVRNLLADSAARSVGPFRDEGSALAFLRDRLVASLHPRMIWLFGSRARGDYRSDSDFDLLVVLPDGQPAAAYSHKAVAAPLVACGLPFDVVPCSLADFATDRDVLDSLVHRAVTEGRLLYQDRTLRRQGGDA
jgi:predicted nucleotidyltransferase